MPEDFKSGFLKTLVWLESYLSEIVIGGGWAPLIYYHYVVGDKGLDPIRTGDIDFMVRRDIPPKGEKTLHQLLLEAGFTPDYNTLDTHPPVTHYEATIDGYDIEIEFLTDVTRAKRDVRVLEVQEGLHAEALRFICISVENTVEVEIDDIEHRTSPLRVLVPRPGAYIFHKGLVFVKRPQKFKKAKDLYYIFELLVRYAPKFPEQIRSDLRDVKAQYPEKWFGTFIKNLERHFVGIDSEGVALVLSQRPTNAFPALNDEQFTQYILFTFQDFIADVKSL